LPLAAELTQAAESDPRLGKVLEALALLASPAEPVAFIPVVHQKQLIKIGAELTRIVHRWEQAADPHYAKIGAESLAYLREFLSK
jgi:hypothetical protein